MYLLKLLGYVLKNDRTDRTIPQSLPSDATLFLTRKIRHIENKSSVGLGQDMRTYINIKTKTANSDF